MYTNPQTSALLAHIASQTKANLDFLVSQNYLRASDAAGVLSRLTSLESESESESGSSPVLSLSERTRQLSLVDRSGDVPERSQSPPKAVMPTRRVVPPPPPPPPTRSQQAKTLWDYSGTDPNDLSFRAGDIIEIVSETNADWWTGTVNGRQGLFPSNYVEKIEARAPPSRGHTPIPVPAPMGRTGPGYGSPSSNYATPPPPSYPAFPSAGPYNPPPPPAWQPVHTPPPGPSQPYGGYAMGENEKQQPVYAPAPVQAPPIVVQQAPPQEGKKKSKFGGLGSTMANSAAGGVGFGAGAAIGAGIIDSIF